VNPHRVIKKTHVLIAILDWGLGHATRCIPVVQCLLENNCAVTLAGSGPSLQLIHKEFPHLPRVILPAYAVTYSSTGNFILHLIGQMPRIVSVIRKEKKIIQQWAQENKVDVIISDNRYGCYSDTIPSVMITHQLSIRLPKGWRVFQGLINGVNARLIRKFRLCWVPDDPMIRLSGRLSERNIQFRYIGILSRFSRSDAMIQDDLIVGLISGPEPQRSELESLLFEAFRRLPNKSVILRGLPGGKPDITQFGRITIMDHAPAHEMQGILRRADFVIARSGYSTLMDLFQLEKKKILFIPTPGQSEQEYLAELMKERGIANFQRQSEMNLPQALSEGKLYHGFAGSEASVNLLRNEILSLLESSVQL
jgi:UDP:flavonoid glycosyltransferase YjiC (YdhE family)